MIANFVLKGRDVSPLKAIVRPAVDTRNVLTDSPWGFVTLWLKRKKASTALYFWKQSYDFFEAARGMPTESAPLLYYYSFMNAVKSLLTVKGIPFEPRHGVSDDNNLTGTPVRLSNIGVRLWMTPQPGKDLQVLPALATFLGESEQSNNHTLQELFLNMPFIHRTYCLTYRTQPDLFFSLVEPRYVVERFTRSVYFYAKLSNNFRLKKFEKRLPPTIVPDSHEGGAIRSVDSFVLSGKKPSARDLPNLIALNTKLRPDLMYINGAQTLWYVKANLPTRANGAKRLSRHPVTLTLAAMHRLSELCRYKPHQLNALLEGEANWLVSEFLQQGPGQVIDQIASEMTGHNFLFPNVRPAS